MLGFQRSKRVGIWIEGPQRLMVHGILDDDMYGLEVRVAIDPSTREIRAVEGWWNRWTTPECPKAADLIQDAVGIRIDQEDLSGTLQKSVGRKACRHFANILIECCHTAREALAVLRLDEPKWERKRIHAAADRESTAPSHGVSAASLNGPVIDLHVHTSPASPCSSAPVDDLIQEARRIGLDGICLTDHNYVWRAEDVEALRRRHDFLVLRGNEITTDQGDVLVFGFEEDIQGVIRLEDLRPKVLEAGGFMIVAHPFRGFLTFGIGKLGLTPEKATKRPVFQYVDAVEVLNGKVTADENRFAGEVAATLGVTVTGGSDAHEVMEVGQYATRFAGPIRNEDDLIAALKKGETAPVSFRKEQKSSS